MAAKIPPARAWGGGGPAPKREMEIAAALLIYNHSSAFNGLFFLPSSYGFGLFFLLLLTIILFFPYVIL